MLVMVEIIVVLMETRRNVLMEHTLARTPHDLKRFKEMDSVIIFYCRLQICFWIYSVLVTIFTTVAMTMDRFIYIMYSINYLNIVTSKVIKTTIGLTWLLPLCLAIPSFLYFEVKLLCYLL